MHEETVEKTTHTFFDGSSELGINTLARREDGESCQ